MKIWAALVIAVGLCGAAEIANGEAKNDMAPTTSLPSETDGWTWDRQVLNYNPTTLFDYIDGAAEMYLAYGVQNVTVRRFEKTNRPPITIELFEMASSADAYGVFSFERQEDSAGIGQGSEVGGGLLRFWKGKYFVSIFADGEGADVESAVLQMGRDAANAIATGPEPKLLAWVPGQDFGLIEKSVRYLKSHILLNQRFFIAHQNILNLNRETEAVLAQYVRQQHKAQLLLVRYPNAQAAGDAYQRFRKAYLPDAGGKDRVRTEDQKWTIVRRQSEFIAVVFGALTEAEGEALLTATETRLPPGR